MAHSKNPGKVEVWSSGIQDDIHHRNLVPMERLPNREQLDSAVYTTIRTYERFSGQTKYLMLQDHIQRLMDSLFLEKSNFRINQESISWTLYQLDKESKIQGDLRIKIIVAPKHEPHLILISEPLQTPRAEAYLHGVIVEFISHMRLNPEAKSYGFAEVQEEIRSRFPPDTEEILMVSPEGEIMEGLSSNFFGIKDGSIHTAERGVLGGITRKIVIELAKEISFSLVMNPILLTQLDELPECFITSTSRGILPVVKIGNKKIGPGLPGPITKRLMNLYDQKIVSIVRPLYGFEESSSVSS